MMFGRRLAAHAWVVGALGFAGAATARPARAQTLTISMTVTASGKDSISPAPTITVHADNVPPELQPSFIRLLISKGSPFQTPFVVQQMDGNSAEFLLSSLLPSRTVVYIRGQLLDRNGNVRAEQVDTANVQSWLRQESPLPRATNVLFTRTPTFTWSTPGITLPPGPWIYRYTILDVGKNAVPYTQLISETSYTPPNPLDACTSYRFSVFAKAVNGSPSDTITVSPGTFVIQSPECPQVTLLYQNFPNPFGAGTRSNQTCFWFDLAHRASVKLTLYTITLHEVKQLVPGFLPGVLDAGPYGRQQGSDASGCDPSLAWDGTDSRGRPVPAGAYIAVFEADGQRNTKKIFYKGR